MSCENCEESAYVIDKLAKLLAEITVIVNGPEPPLTSWSYHDLPEKVRALKQAPPAAGLADQEPLCLEVGNYYGMLKIRCKAGAPEWCVENHSGCHWDPCPRPVYDALLAAARKGE